MKALLGQTTNGQECCFVRPGDGSFDVLFSAAPITSDQKVIGMIATLFDITQHNDEELQLREDAVSNERDRMAADLHDTLCQNLNAIMLMLNAAEHELADEPERARSHFRCAHEMAVESLADARRTMWTLSHESLENEDLAPALSFLAQQFFAGTPVELKLSLQPETGVLPLELRGADWDSKTGYGLTYVHKWDYLTPQAGVILRYLRQSVWPSGQALDYFDWPTVQTFLHVVGPCLFVLALLTLSIVLCFKKRWEGFLGAWFFLILVAAGLARLRPAWLLGTALAGILFLGSQGVSFIYAHDFDNERDAAVAAAGFILDHAHPGDAIIFHIAATRIPYEFVRSLRTPENAANTSTAAQLGPEILFPQHAAGLDYRDFTGKPTADLLRTAAPSHPRVWIMLMNNAPTGNPDPTTLMMTQVLPESFPQMLRWQFPKVEVRLYSKQ